MAVTTEEVRRKIENAQNAGDDNAVRLLKNYLQTLETPAPTPTAPEPQGALSPVEMAPEENLTGEGFSGPALSRKQRERRILQRQYERDQALAGGAGKPSQRELADFRNKHFNVHAEGGHIFSDENRGREIVKDPMTGKVRWAALSPDQIDEFEAKKNGGSLAKAIPPAMLSGLTRQVGQRLEDVDEGIEERRTIQSVIWTQLPSHEQSRIRRAIAAKAGVGESDVTDEKLFAMPARVLKKYLDENPANESLIDNIAGDEAEVSRGEGWRRIGNRVSAVVPRMPTNIFGAEDTLGDVTGPGKYEGLADLYAEKDKRAPLYPGASDDVRKWRSDSRAGEGSFGDLYEYLIRPAFTTPEGDRPGARIQDLAEVIKDKTYTTAQRESAKKPFFPKDKTWRDAFSTEMWTDPDTKLPWNDWDGFVLTVAETTPQIAEGIIAARLGGRIGAREAVRSMSGRSLASVEKARRQAATAGGVITGGTAEGAMIYDEVASEVRRSLLDVPLERWREDPTFQRMVEAGLSEDDAKQLLTHDAATTAGKTGFVVAGWLMGSPMSAAFGRASAGSLGKRNFASRFTMGALGEGIQEGSQEVGEGEISDITVAKIDPNNPIFDDANRRLERFAGGFFVGLAMGGPGMAEPETPAGLEKEDVEAADLTKKYFDATNARYQYEFEISDPAYIQRTNPLKRLQDMKKLERLQSAEAEAVLEAEPVLREYFEANPSQTSRAELKMLDALKMRANVTLTDIAVARSRKQSLKEMVEEQEKVFSERAEIQKKVTDNIMKLEDVERQIANIEAVQNNEPVDEQDYTELLKEGYGRWTNKNKDKFVITPKGKRAMNLLNQQRRDLTKNLEQAYTGEDRRKTENLLRRETIDSAGPVEREQLLYQDHLTGMQNRRAFDERGQDAPAVAAVDVDSLAWINDNMSHTAGDRLLIAVADAIEKQKGVEVFRLGGDEFAVTGPSQEALETAMQAAAKELANTPIAAGDEQVTPQITWGKGENYAEADAESGAMKIDRIKRGVIATRKGKAATWSHRAQRTLFQRGAITLPQIDQWMDSIVADREHYRDAFRFERAIKAEKIERMSPEERQVAVEQSVETDALIEAKQLSDKEIGQQKYNRDRIKIRRESVLERYEAGATPKQIASELGVSSMTIHNDLKALKVKKRRTRRTKEARDWQVQLRDAVRELHNEGMSINEIASDTGLKVSAVRDMVGLITGDEKVITKFMMEEPQLPDRWNDISHIVERGHHVEILTPAGAVQGTVTKVAKGKRPRLYVNAQGRRFVFNPKMNHLITAKSDEADIAWLADSPEFADPLYGPLPQIIPEVQIGFLSMDGDYYADLGFEAETYQQQIPWWWNEYSDCRQSHW
jgi:diguanylate cyclase (GGDEF)-like protein